MFSLFILYWVMGTLSAPTWCYVLWWIALVTKVISFIGDIFKLGRE